MAEIVTTLFHRQAVDAHHGLMLRRRAVLVRIVIVVVPRQLQHLVGDEILARTVRLHDGANQVLRHILIVGQQLLAVLGQAITAVAKGRIVVMATNARVQAHAVDDMLRGQPLDLSIGIQLIEIRHPQRKIRIREKLHRLRLRRAHIERRDILLNSALLQQPGEKLRILPQAIRRTVVIRCPHDDARGVQIILQGMSLPQELRAEQNPLVLIPSPDLPRISHRYRALDHDQRLRLHRQHQLDDLFHRTGIKEVLAAVIICRRGHDHHIRITVRRRSIQRRPQIQLMLRQIRLNLRIPDRAAPRINHLHLRRHNIHRRHRIMLRQQHRQRQPDIPRAGHGNFNLTTMNQHAIPPLRQTKTALLISLGIHNLFIQTIYAVNISFIGEMDYSFLLCFLCHQPIFLVT